MKKGIWTEDIQIRPVTTTMADDLMAAFEAEMQALQKQPAAKTSGVATTKVISAKPVVSKVISAKPVVIQKAPVKPTSYNVPAYPAYHRKPAPSPRVSAPAQPSIPVPAVPVAYPAPAPIKPYAGAAETEQSKIERQQSAYNYEKVASIKRDQSSSSNSSSRRDEGDRHSSRSIRSDGRDDRHSRSSSSRSRDDRYQSTRIRRDERSNRDERSHSSRDAAPPQKKAKSKYANVKINPQVGVHRYSGGHVWEDKTMAEWPQGDHRVFVGDLGNEVTDDLLAHTFNKYASFAKAKVIRDKFNNKSKGFGFISFLDPFDMVKAIKEMNGQYCGNRPMKLRKSTWKDRNVKSKKQLRKLRGRRRPKLSFH